MTLKKPKLKTEPTHVTRGDVFADLGFSTEEAAVLRLKTALHIEIMKVIRRRKLTPRELEEVLGLQQPKVSDLMTGKISKMTADKLTRYLHRLGRQVTVSTKPDKDAHAA